jgi:hypothetical protein
MNALAQPFEDSAIDQAITFLVVAPVQIAIAIGWEVGKLAVSAARMTAIVLAWLFAALTENYQIVGKLVAIVVATFIVASVWQIGIGVGVVVVLTAIMKRRGKI